MNKKVSLTEKYLPKDLWKWLQIKTHYGTTIYDCIKSGVENPDSEIGLYAPDPDSYDTFHELFYPVISEYHKVDANKVRSLHDLGDASKLEDISSEYTEHILGTRVAVSRNLRGFPLASKLSREQRLEIESRVREALSKLDGELAGSYKSLSEMSYDERNKLIEERVLYNDADDKYIRSAGAYADWPIGRGVFMNKTKNFIVWINEEDHLKVISAQKGASLKSAWSRLLKALHGLESRLEFVRHEKFGYLTFCPANIGTSLEASVLVKVPKTADSGKLKDLCNSLDLDVKASNHSNVEAGLFEVSNKIRIGHTEWDLVNTMMTGARKLLDFELKK